MERPRARALRLYGERDRDRQLSPATCTQLCSSSKHTCGYFVSQWCLTLRTPLGCSPPGSSVCGIPQARLSEWVAIFLLQGTFWELNMCLLCLPHCRQILYPLSIGEAPTTIWLQPYKGFPNQNLQLSPSRIPDAQKPWEWNVCWHYSPLNAGEDLLHGKRELEWWIKDQSTISCRGERLHWGTQSMNWGVREWTKISEGKCPRQRQCLVSSGNSEETQMWLEQVMERTRNSRWVQRPDSLGSCWPWQRSVFTLSSEAAGWFRAE